MKHVNGCYKKMIPPKHEKLLEVHKYWITDSLDYRKFKHIHLVGGEHGCMDNWKYWIIGCPITETKYVHGVLLGETIHQESEELLKKST